MHDPQGTSLSHGTSGILLAYVLVFAAMLVALIRSRSRMSPWLMLPLSAVAVTIVAAIAAALVVFFLESAGLSRGGFLQGLVSITLYLGIGYAGGLALAGRPPADGAHRRGAVVSDAGSGQAPGEEHRNPSLTLAGMALTQMDETKHFKLIGTTGTGKSTAINEMIAAALTRGDRAIIADPDGGYLSRFYDADRGDVILNPFEPGSVKWSLLGEISNGYDVDQLARSLIPDGGSGDQSWTEYARTFFIAIVQKAVESNLKDDGAIYRLVAESSTKDLKSLLAGTVAGPFLEDGNERMFGSVRSVTSSALRALKYIDAQRGVPFSVRRWVREGAARQAGGRGGVLFMPYKAGEIAALRSMISAWMRIAIFEAMNRGEGDQHLWFVVDELDALGEIDGLKDALARLRKFGGRCVLGFQSISQVSSTYGRGVADTIVENCGNTLILRCSASEQGGTSQFASKLIGQREVVHSTKSRTRRPTEWLASTTRSEHRTIEPAVMASEIERLADLEGFLKVASLPDWHRATLTYVGGTGERRSTIG